MNEIINNARLIFEQLHFIRADWFYAFIPVILFLMLASTKKLNDKNWTSVIDPQLMPFVLSRSNSVKQRRYPLILAFIASSLCITALAGPVYKKLPQPVYREQSSLVVLLDLSQSMDATDIKPSRLARAKLELLDILKTRKTGQTALIVYAADAFVVTPLTDDNATIANLVPSLETDMMPAQGSQLSTALSKTLSLFQQAGVINGDILVITDDIHSADESAIKKVASQGYRLSIFGIGTAEGAPVPVEAGFLKNSNGAIVIPKLDAARLQRYALAGGGLYTGIRAGDKDVEKLSRLFQSSSVEQNTDNKNLDADIWQEEGYWLLLPLLFFSALWSRKGWLAVLLPFALPCLLIFSALQPQPAYAAEATDTATTTAPIIDAQNLWFSPDQKAMKAFEQGDNETAARQFTDPDWKASAYYRKGDYEAAAKALENSEHNDAYYNKANALAKLGKYEEAIKAYDKAIELDNNNEDAKYNREQVKQALTRQQEQQQNQQQNDKDSDDQQSDDKKSGDKDSQKQDSENQDSNQQDSENQDTDKQDSEQQDSQQQSSDQSKDKNDQQAEEEKQLKQRDEAAEKKEQEEQQSQYEQQQKENEQKNDTDKTEPEESEPNESEQVENSDSKEKPAEVEVNPVEASITEDEKATEQWLKRIPDDPGGLLRRKFYYQYKQAPNQKDDKEPW